MSDCLSSAFQHVLLLSSGIRGSVYATERICNSNRNFAPGFLVDAICA